MKRFWRYALLGAGGLSGLAVISAAGLYSYQEFYHPAEQQYAAGRYQPARDATEPPSPVKQQPAPKAYDPHCDQPQNHDDADLCAQWAAERAITETNRLTRIVLKLGYVGFWVALLGGLIGIVGAIFLVKTFRENKRSADAAHDANRPWLDLKVIVDEMITGAQGVRLDLAVEIENSGKSPAMNVMAITRMIPIPSSKDSLRSTVATDAIKEVFAHWRRHERSLGVTVFPGKQPTQPHRCDSPQSEIVEAMGQPPVEIVLMVGVGVRYRFGERTAWTIKSYRVSLPIGAEKIKNLVVHHHGAVELDESLTAYIT